MKYKLLFHSGRGDVNSKRYGTAGNNESERKVQSWYQQFQENYLLVDKGNECPTTKDAIFWTTSHLDGHLVMYQTLPVSFAGIAVKYKVDV